ncbi:hypothetical protein A2415_02395 [candidate division WWE3 bacterium RIFOXYC1_FULL_39_7]|uniref:Uncharacterized protein n=2 Tax=Katanobacteria TaxID=422282 RepID=A0A1F4X5W8_UNCKA|nr:MAG: hypothetical protein A2415_02395 [candidate division WWE3 bacterium RIFOXYC1_FULL_39_7]OGC77067.1 MAG: hypothetical protein A2619_01575 [candidate division WWE3 bacterium RIFOXYD1_FULL_39_9]
MDIGRIISSEPDIMPTVKNMLAENMQVVIVRFNHPLNGQEQVVSDSLEEVTGDGISPWTVVKVFGTDEKVCRMIADHLGKQAKLTQEEPGMWRIDLENLTWDQIHLNEVDVEFAIRWEFNAETLVFHSAIEL